METAEASPYLKSKEDMMGSKRVVGSVRRWTKWTCSSCQYEVDLGVLSQQNEAGKLSTEAFERARTQCPNCGSPKSKRSEGETYQSAGSSAVVITDQSILARTGKGANRECEYCGSENVVLDAAGEKIIGCRNCGADLKGQTRHPEEDEPSVSPPAVRDSSRPAPDLMDANRSGDAFTSKLFLILGGLGALALLIWLLIFLFGKHEGEAKVTDTSWQVTHVVYQRQVNSESGWKSDLSSGAYDLSCTKKFKKKVDCTHKDCNPHKVDCNPYECSCTEEVDNSQCVDKEDGTEDCPIVRSCDTCYEQCTEYDYCHPDGDELYEDWCDYKHDTWPEFRRETTNGSDSSPRPPALEAHGSDQKIDRETVLAVIFVGTRGDEGSWTLHPSSLSDYQRYEVDQTWKIDYNLVGQIWPKELIQ